jgi:hypothetical protein
VKSSSEEVTDPEFSSEHQPSISCDENPRPALQTFVFSATLSKELQQNLKKRWQPKGAKKNHGPASTLDDLLLRLDFRDSEPEIIDISPEGGVVSTLKESRIECLAADKVRVISGVYYINESSCIGCPSLLLPSAISRTNACVSIINRRDSQADTLP